MNLFRGYPLSLEVVVPSLGTDCASGTISSDVDADADDDEEDEGEEDAEADDPSHED
jgi:hypothetical protein